MELVADDLRSERVLAVIPDGHQQAQLVLPLLSDILLVVQCVLLYAVAVAGCGLVKEMQALNLNVMSLQLMHYSFVELTPGKAQ